MNGFMTKKDTGTNLKGSHGPKMIQFVHKKEK